MRKTLLTFLSVLMLLCFSFGLTACGEVDNFNVYFKVDGEIYATATTDGSSSVTIPNNPIKEGYTFEAWFWDEGVWQKPFTVNSLFDAPITSDMTVYAKFNKNHTHTYSSDWTNDENYHWHSATCEHTEEIKDKASHSLSDWIIDSNATYTKKGSKHKECSICKKVLQTEEIPMLIKDEITFKTLSADNLNNVYGKVSNTQTTFSFINEVNVSGNATFVVSTDIYGIQQIPTKTVPLSIGDNTFYVTETVGNNIKLYTVTVRRKPIYNVTFNSNGGTSVNSQEIEEDSFAVEPTTTRTGYTFDKWNYDFTKSITQNTTITASWTANTDTKYKVEYYLQNLDDDKYTIDNTATENLTGTTDTTAIATIKSYEHFTVVNDNASGNIAGDSSLVLKVYYTRDKYTITVNGNISKAGAFTNLSGTYKYGKEINLTATTNDGYTFNGWLNNEELLESNRNYTFNVDKNITITASWIANTYQVIFDSNGGESVENKTATYDSSFTMPTITRSGYTFAGWYNGNTKYTTDTWKTASDIILTAKWSADVRLSDDGKTVIGRNNNVTNLVVLEQYDGYSNKVTRIGNSAFGGCSSLTEVIIPNSVTSIGYEAFYNCTSLTSVKIPDSVTSIGYGAFYNCPIETATIPAIACSCIKNSKLKTVNITSGTSIGNEAFSECSKLTSVVIPNSVTSIGYGAFNNCSSLKYNEYENAYYLGNSNNPYIVLIKAKSTSITTCTITKNCKFIHSHAFCNCSSLTSITISDSVTSIGSSAFGGCTSLTSITIPDSVTSIGEYAFFYCSSLEEVTIGDNVTSIGSSAFYNCSSLTSITIPDSVTSIGSYAFYNCSSLTEVIIPNSVTSIGDNAFYNCPIETATIPAIACSYIKNSKLKTVNITSGTSIGNKAFSECSSLTEVIMPNSVTSIGDDAFSSCSSLKSVTIGDNVTSIGRSAFYNCSSLKSVTIGNSVTSIGYDAFYGCTSLTDITLPDSVTSIRSSAFSSCTSLTSVTIPDSVTSIGSSAFSSCTSLTSVTIPDSVTSIGSYAFYNCSSLTEVIIPNSVTSIGDNAFYNCPIETATIPALACSYIRNSMLKTVKIISGTSIGYEAFSNCSSLEEVTIGDNVTSIGSSAFYDCSSLTEVNYLGDIDSWCEIEFSGVFSNPLYYAKNLYINNELVTEANITTATKINGYAFDGCTSLTSVTIGNSVTSIGWAAFEGCSSLTEVIIPNSVTSIGWAAFGGCTSLTSITIPDSVTSISASAFAYCMSLNSITIPNSVTSIGSYAFRCCSSLTSITIPNSVTSIGSYAFDGCSKLTSITIPNSVTSIGSYAFDGCALSSVTFSDTTTWYRTENITNWQNKTEGIQIDNTALNTILLKKYCASYFYKVD